MAQRSALIADSALSPPPPSEAVPLHLTPEHVISSPWFTGLCAVARQVVFGGRCALLSSLMPCGLGSVAQTCLDVCHFPLLCLSCAVLTWSRCLPMLWWMQHSRSSWCRLRR